ncbi:MAG: hypothetical protein CML06_06400 [Pseudomonadales bacterium]|nr:hypothetical protein [Pseudomonadales bacterium]
MALREQYKYIPAAIGTLTLVSVVALEYLFILQLNHGVFVYTLDDPYIHLALAENIRLGHYGINLEEASAPSSSILWPFLIAPFAGFEPGPLLLNLLAALASVVVLGAVLNLSLPLAEARQRLLLHSVLAVLFIFATNLIGLVFTGMEHSLQVLLVMLIGYGLLREADSGEVKPWLLLALIAAPLVRYECLSVSLAGLGFLLLRRHWRAVLTVAPAIGLLLVAFSLFLLSLGLDPYPTSVAAKSSVVHSGGALGSVFWNLKTALFDERQGIVMAAATLPLLGYYLLAQDPVRRQLALVTLLAVALHYAVGRFNWYNRYEIYIWAFMLVVSIYLFAPGVQRIIRSQPRGLAATLVLVVALGLYASAGYVYGLYILPLASNNIYEQQYQMHKFATDFHAGPVAVNDLGYVAYKNDHYVLDLWGLGSKQAFERRTGGEDPGWMQAITREHGVDLVMIYEGWFEEVPATWIKLGELALGKRDITAARTRVAFLATRPQAVPSLHKQLQQFARSLPQGVRFHFQTHPQDSSVAARMESSLPSPK